MNVTIQTAGGFASIPALSRSVTLDTAKIDPLLAQQLESLVADAALFDRPPLINTTLPGAADYRTYTITVQDGARVNTVRLTDPILDPTLERLLSQFQAAARLLGP